VSAYLASHPVDWVDWEDQPVEPTDAPKTQTDPT
jgi:hypothetical protein